MAKVYTSLIALLAGCAVVLVGQGLLNTLIPLRAGLEGFSETDIGLLGALYYAGFGIGCVASPYLVRRVGHIRAFLAVGVLHTAAVLVLPLLIVPWVWVTARVLMGAAMAGFYMILESWLNERSPHEHRGRVLAIYVIISFSAMVAGQQVLTLAEPSAFQLFSFAAIIMSLGLLPVALSTAPAPAPPTTVSLQLGRLYRLSPVGVYGALAVGLANGAFWALAPLFVAETAGILGSEIPLAADGLAPPDSSPAADVLSVGDVTTAVAAFMTAAILGGALGQWPFGWLSDRVDRRFVIAGLAALSAVTGGLIWLGTGSGLLAAGAMPTLVLVGLYGAAAMSIYAVCVAHTNDRAEPSDFVAAASGMLLLFAIGATVGPVVASALMAVLGPAGLFALTVAVHLSLVAWALLRWYQRPAVATEVKETFVPVSTVAAGSLDLDPRAPDPSWPEDGAEAQDDPGPAAGSVSDGVVPGDSPPDDTAPDGARAATEPSAERPDTTEAGAATTGRTA